MGRRLTLDQGAGRQGLDKMGPGGAGGQVNFLGRQNYIQRLEVARHCKRMAIYESAEKKTRGWARR